MDLTSPYGMFFGRIEPTDSVIWLIFSEICIVSCAFV